MVTGDLTAYGTESIGRFLMDKKRHSLLVSMNTLAYLQYLYIKFASALYHTSNIELLYSPNVASIAFS